MAEEIPWSEDTNGIIDDLESLIYQKYSISLRDLLLKPQEYAKKEGISEKINAIKGDVNAYISQLLSSLSAEQAKFNKDLENADAQYQKVSATIAEKANANNVPYIVPLAINRNEELDETIIIDVYNSNLDAFIERLVKISNYVADISATYKGHRLGAWIFSGNKVYYLALNPPTSSVLIVENAGAEINSRLDMALQQ